MDILKFIVIGITAGMAAGLFGIGGGIIIVPFLVYWLGFTQHMATGTSLAVLLPPIGFLAVWEYYQKNNVDMYAALWIAGAMILSSFLAAKLAQQLKGPQLQLAFAIFLIVVGIYTAQEAVRKIWFRLEV